VQTSVALQKLIEARHAQSSFSWRDQVQAAARSNQQIAKSPKA
jgi:hypothetical protein